MPFLSDGLIAEILFHGVLKDCSEAFVPIMDCFHLFIVHRYLDHPLSVP